MTAYYNENNPFAADWLETLISLGVIAAGEVDRRSIEDVQSDDLAGFTQCHFFAGIGGWSYACRLAGWPDDKPVWTASLPCQPFSVAGKGRGKDDERHLFPAFASLARERRPSIVFGEQVASKAGRAWFRSVRNEMEGMGYGAAAADLCASGVGAPHPRQRLYWLAHPVGMQQWREKPCRGAAGRMGRVIKPFSWHCGWESALRQFRGVDDGLSYGVGVTDGFRNAIVPALAQAFIEANYT